MAGQVMEEEWGNRGGERTEEKERSKQIYMQIIKWIFPAIEPSYKYTEKKWHKTKEVELKTSDTGREEKETCNHE